MSIEELFAKKNVKSVINNLELLSKDLISLTKPLRSIMSPEEKAKTDLFSRVKELRIETENLIQQISEKDNKNDLNVIKKITQKVKEIITEKEQIKKELIKIKIKDEMVSN